MGTKDNKLSMNGTSKDRENNVFKSSDQDVTIKGNEFQSALIINKNIKDKPMTQEESFVSGFPHPIKSMYYMAAELPLNVVTQKSVFSDNVFTANAERLMDNFKHFGNPIDIDEYVKCMDDTKPFNITKYQPAAGKFILLGISGISPLVLSGISKENGPDIDKYTDPYKYFIVGVPNKEFNHRFGMKAIYKLKALNATTYNGIPISNQDDPLSGYNLRQTYTELKQDIIKDKDSAAIARVLSRTILLVDEMDIDGYTY